jgi:hypothetical protein
MKQFLLLIFIGALTFLPLKECIAQSDHLESSNSIFDIYDFQFEYYSHVRNILFDGMTDMPEIRFLVLPSFSPEYVVSVEKDEDDNHYLVYHIGKESIWYSEKKDKIKVEKLKREIGSESAELIKELFIEALKDTRQVEGMSQGLDGVNYYFSVNDWGPKTGTIWSPDDGTNMRELVNIGNELISIIKKSPKGEQINFQPAYKTRIKNLIEKIK